MFTVGVNILHFVNQIGNLDRQLGVAQDAQVLKPKNGLRLRQRVHCRDRGHARGGHRHAIIHT